MNSLQFDYKKISLLLGSPIRWGILRELSKGEGLPAGVLAARLGKKSNLMTKHLSVMRVLGVVRPGYGRLYSILPAFLPSPGSQVVDFGICRVDFGQPNGL